MSVDGSDPLIRSVSQPRVAEMVGLVSRERLACFSEFCGPLPDLDAAANDPCVASPAASRRVRPSGSLAAGYLAPLGSDLPEDVAEHWRLEQGPDFVLDRRNGFLHGARVVVLVMRITRRLKPGEGRLYRAVRLEALRESPGAFLSRYEDALGRSDESWAEQADSGAEGTDRATFVTIVDRPVGVASLYRDEDEAEVGELLQMWVAPEVRGGTVAGELLMAVLGWAEGNGFAVVRAEVMGKNARALRFYEKFGFALCSGDRGGGCVLLSRRVRAGCGGGEVP